MCAVVDQRPRPMGAVLHVSVRANLHSVVDERSSRDIEYGITPKRLQLAHSVEHFGG